MNVLVKGEQVFLINSVVFFFCKAKADSKRGCYRACLIEMGVIRPQNSRQQITTLNCQKPGDCSIIISSKVQVVSDQGDLTHIELRRLLVEPSPIYK